MTKLANKLLTLYCSVTIIAVCIRNHIPIMEVGMLIVAILYGMLIGLQDE